MDAEYIHDTLNGHAYWHQQRAMKLNDVHHARVSAKLGDLLEQLYTLWGKHPGAPLSDTPNREDYPAALKPCLCRLHVAMTVLDGDYDLAIDGLGKYHDNILSSNAPASLEGYINDVAEIYERSRVVEQAAA